MKTTTKYDVLIIGAGPAGSLAGAVLARKGRSVLCLERGYFPRPVIGESLLPRCNELLDRAGLLAAVEARGYMVKRAATFLHGDKTIRFPFSDGLSGDRPTTFQVPRDDFDMTLATGARSAGVDLRFGQQVDGVDFGADGASIATTDTETNQTYRVQARFVLDCSGYGRVLPRLLDLEAPAGLPERVACFCHVENDMRPQGETAGDIWICIHPENGWIWIIPFTNGRTSVGIICDRDVWDARTEPPRDRLFGFLLSDPNARRRLARAVPVTCTNEIRGYSKKATAIHGPGWALAGNAAGFLDPVFSSGVCLALETGWLATTLIDRSLSGEEVDWSKEYEPVVHRAFAVFLAFVEGWYRRDVEQIFFSGTKLPRIRRFVTSILGGNVLRDDNPFAVNPEIGLRQLQEKLARASMLADPPGAP